MAFPSQEELQSLHRPVEFGGEGFEVVRFVYERAGDGRAHARSPGAIGTRVKA